MTTQAPGALLALLEDVDWDAPGLDGVDPRRISYIKSQLPALVNVALATTEDDAREAHWAMDGDAQVGLFYDYPMQGSDVLTRLLPHASVPGGDWIMRDLRVIVEELPKVSGRDEDVVDAVCAFLVERRGTIDLAASDSAVRLRHLAHIATLVESEEWNHDVSRAALALGATDIVATIASPVRLWPAGGCESPRENQQRRIQKMFRAGRARTHFDEAALGAIYLEWQGNRKRFSALLYSDDSQDVILGSTLTSSRWVLRSDRVALAAVRSGLTVALSTASMPRPAWLGFTRRVVVRAWINGQCRELRLSRARRASDSPDARTWAELLGMLESTSR